MKSVHKVSATAQVKDLNIFDYAAFLDIPLKQRVVAIDFIDHTEPTANKAWGFVDIHNQDRPPKIMAGGHVALLGRPVLPDTNDSLRFLSILREKGFAVIGKAPAKTFMALPHDALEKPWFMKDLQHGGASIGIALSPVMVNALQSIMLVMNIARVSKNHNAERFNLGTTGVLWNPKEETVAQFIACTVSAKKEMQRHSHLFKTQENGALLVRNENSQPYFFGVLVDKTFLLNQILPMYYSTLEKIGMDWGDIEGSLAKFTAHAASAALQVVKEKAPEPIPAPPPWWDGEANTLFMEVLTGNPLTFQTEGALPVLADLPSATESQGRSGKGREGREPQPLDALPQVVKSRFVVLAEPLYMAAVDARRSAAKRTIEEVTSEALGYHRRDTINLLPDQLGLVPSIVGGQYGYWRDRLARVRLLNPTVVVQATDEERVKRLKNPLCYKVTVDGKVQTLQFTDTTPQMVAICPAGWLASPNPWWVAGLFGTPLDPTLLEFCETMPAQWWDKLDALNAKMAKAGADSLDFAALLTNRALAA